MPSRQMAAVVEPSAAARASISAHNACAQDPRHGGKTFHHCWDCSSASPYAIPLGNYAVVATDAESYQGNFCTNLPIGIGRTVPSEEIVNRRTEGRKDLKRTKFGIARLDIDADSVDTFGYPHGIYPSKAIIGSSGNHLPIFSVCHVSALRARIRWHLRQKRGFGKSRPQLLVVPAWDRALKTNCEVAIHLTPSEYLRRDRVAACALSIHAPLLFAF